MASPKGHRIAEVEGRMSVTILYDGKVHVMGDDNPAFGTVCAHIANGKDYESAMKCFDKETVVKEAVAASVLSDRIEIRDGMVWLDGEACDNAITDIIIDLADEGEDYTPLANFFALLSDNPIHHSRNRLFDWLRAANSFSLDKDGYIVGYKGLDNEFKSKYWGPGIVNGVAVNGGLDNSPGNVLEIDEVEFDPEVGCAHGLHVGTFDYASKWAGHDGKLVSVRVSPANVGSVPTDCSDQKMRVFKYEVIEEVDAPYQERIVK